VTTFITEEQLKLKALSGNQEMYRYGKRSNKNAVMP
jgi:hypothetical protein